MRVQELLTDLRVPYRGHGESPHVTEGWVGVECPFCGRGTGRFGLGYNLRTGYTTCWKCGPHSLAEVLAEILEKPVREVRSLCGDLDRPRLFEGDEKPGRLELPAGITELLPVHRRYLEGRGFDPDELVDRWKIQGIGVAVRLAWRIFIPIHKDLEVVSWTTRTPTDDGEPTNRYRGAKRHQERVHRKAILYGADQARSGVVVHEGPFDVWATGPGAVCTCGVGFSRAQVRQLARYPVRAVCFDNDPAAQRRARQLAAELEVMPGETYVVRLDAKDAASAVKERPAELRELRKRFLD